MYIERRQVADDWSALVSDWVIVRDGKSQEFRVKQRLYSGTELKKTLSSAGFAKLALFGALDAKASYDESAGRLVEIPPAVRVRAEFDQMDEFDGSIDGFTLPPGERKMAMTSPSSRAVSRPLRERMFVSFFIKTRCGFNCSFREAVPHPGGVGEGVQQIQHRRTQSEADFCFSASEHLLEISKELDPDLHDFFFAIARAISSRRRPASRRDWEFENSHSFSRQNIQEILQDTLSNDQQTDRPAASREPAQGPAKSPAPRVRQGLLSSTMSNESASRRAMIPLARARPDGTKKKRACSLPAVLPVVLKEGAGSSAL